MFSDFMKDDGDVVIQSAISLKPVPQNFHSVDWAPGGVVAVASEHFVTVYELKSREFRIIQVFSKHRSNISCIKWNYNTVEPLNSHSFRNYLAVGDETGNCLIYRISSSNHVSGLSSTNGNKFSILDLQWSREDPAVLFILTSIPSLICVSVTNQRRSSLLEAVEEPSNQFQFLCMKSLWYVVLKEPMDFVSIDPFNKNSIVLASQRSTFTRIHTNKEFLNPLVSSNQVFPLQHNEIVVSIEHFALDSGAIIITTQSKFYIYDMRNSTITPFYEDIQHSLPPQHNLFHLDSRNKFWCVSNDGCIYRFKLNSEESWSLSSFVHSNCGKVQYSIGSKYDSHLIAVHFQCGRVVVFEEKGQNKLFAIAMIHGTNNQIVSWDSNSNGYAILTNSGSVILNIKNQKMHFQIQDQQPQTLILSDDRVSIIGESLTLIDINTRSITIPHKATTPKSLLCNNRIFAYIALPNVIDILNENNTKKTIAFRNNILVFTYDRKSPNRWCVLLDNGSCFIFETTNSKSTQQKVIIPDHLKQSSCLVLNGDILYFATPKCEISRFEISTASIITQKHSVFPIMALSILSNSLLFRDSDNNFGILDGDSLKVISIAKWKVIEAKFMNQNIVVIQTSKMSLRLTQIPHFESYTYSNPGENPYRKLFFCSNSLAELYSATQSIGDMKFQQFIKTLIMSSNSLYSLFPTTKEEFIECIKSRCACDRHNALLQKRYIDYLLFTGQMEKAAEYLIQQDTESSLLLSYICLSQNHEVSQKILDKWTHQNHLELMGRICVIAGDKERALSLFIESQDKELALFFLRIAFNDNEIIERIPNLPNKKLSHQYSYLLDVHSHRYIDALTKLYNNGELARAYSVVLLMKEKNINIDDPLIGEILSKWNSL